MAMVVLTCATVAASVARAQVGAGGGGGGAPVVIVTGSPLPAGKRAMVLVRRSTIPREVVVLDSSATAEDLAASMQTLRALEVSLPPDGLQRDIRAFPSRFVPRQEWETTHKRRYAKQVNDLRRASRRNIPGLGTLRAIEGTRGRRGNVLEY
jgi:hypothetical protein